MTNIIAGITKDLKAVPKKLKEKAKSADVKKLILLNLPYVLAGYFCNKAAFLWRVAEGSNASDKMMVVMSQMDRMFSNPFPSFFLSDLLIGIAGGVADIISEGAVPEEIKRATELLEKLTEYKPLAKIEEAEEQNYNMIDNVLNNGVGEKAQREENKRMEEKPTVRLSLKSRLAEKKSQVEGQSKEHDVQENEKKSQREM